MKKWKCGGCGYVWDGDEAPERCPKCGAPKEKFELLDVVVSIQGQGQHVGDHAKFVLLILGEVVGLGVVDVKISQGFFLNPKRNAHQGPGRVFHNQVATVGLGAILGIDAFAVPDNFGHPPRPDGALKSVDEVLGKAAGNFDLQLPGLGVDQHQGNGAGFQTTLDGPDGRTEGFFDMACVTDGLGKVQEFFHV